MVHYELPIVSFVAAFLVLLPLPWHWKSRNVATVSLIVWLFLVNLTRGINSIIWMGNVTMRLPIWCDITTKLVVGASVAFPACSFCIARHLELVSSARYAISTAADKRRRQKVDLLITVGIPFLIMALHYIVQGHRYDLFEDLGPNPNIYLAWQAVLIVYVPPNVLNLGAFVYALMALRHFAMHRMQFSAHLKNSQSALTLSRYLRLMALALTEVVWGTALGIYTLYLDIKLSGGGFRPYISWYNVHYHFSRVVVYPAFLLPKTILQRFFLVWWMVPATAFVFFVFFGFGEEAMANYSAVFRWIRRKVFRQTLSSKDTFTQASTIPSFRKPPVNHVSLPTFADISFEMSDSKHVSVSPPPRKLSLPNTMRSDALSVMSLSYPGPATDVDVELGHPDSVSLDDHHGLPYNAAAHACVADDHEIEMNVERNNM